jgi:hypothetical protein
MRPPWCRQPVPHADARGLPAFFEFAAPPAWRAVDFISDLHLCEAMPRTFDAAPQHLRHTNGRCGVHPGRPVRGLGRRRQRVRALRAACVDLLAEAAAPPAPGLHGRQPRLPGGARPCCAPRHDGPARPHGAGRLGPAAAAEPRRRAVPGRHCPTRPSGSRCAARPGSRTIPGQAAGRAAADCRRDPPRQRARQRSTATAAPTWMPPRPCAGCTPWARPRWCTATRTGPAATRWRRASSAMC